MGWYDYVSWVRIILPMLFLLFFPAALRFMTTFNYTSISSSLGSKNVDKPMLIKPQTQVSRPEEDRASHAILVSENNRSSIVKKNAETVRLRWGPVEEGLSRARVAIRRASNESSSSIKLPNKEIPLPRIYRNPSAFYRSYVEMEKQLKIYVYKEGEPPLVHDGPCKNIYSIEGRFIEELEMMNGRFRTREPTKANLFFLPFSVAWMVKYVYNARMHTHAGIRRLVADYINVVASKHPFWNRTSGADHFMLSCHDWGPIASSANLYLYKNSIRALCNANISEGFKPDIDVSIPEIHLLTGDYPSQLLRPLPPLSARPLLAFFAGGLHGPIRPLILQAWGSHQDPLIQVHQYLPKGVNYFNDYMLQSQFCLCPSGYEVASPRVVEAILAECVPVLISQGYYAPFSDVLKWEEFSISIEVEEIPRLKEILSGIAEHEIERLREGLRAVKRHFLLNRPAKRFDAFHMILHSVWLRRLNLRVRGV